MEQRGRILFVLKLQNLSHVVEFFTIFSRLELLESHKATHTLLAKSVVTHTQEKMS